MRFFALALAVVVGGAACPADPGQKKREPVVVVGDAVIEERQAVSLLAQRGVARIHGDADRAAVVDDVLEQLVDEELLLQAAQKASITVADEAVDREMRNRAEGYGAGNFQSVLTAEQLTLDGYRENIRRRLLQDAYLRVRLAHLPPITEQEIQARYDATLAQQKRPPQVRARQVLLRTAEEAKHVLGEIQTRRITTEQAAQKYSVGLEKDVGGDLGWFAQGEMPKVFDVCFALEPGQVSTEVIASDYGFHIFQVIDKRPERVEPLAAVRDQIAEDLLRERQSAELEKILAELRQQIRVTVKKDAVKRLVALLPPAPATPSVGVEDGTARALDSHDDGIDPIPPLPKY